MEPIYYEDDESREPVAEVRLPQGWPDYKHMWFRATEDDPEPDTYAVVSLGHGWMGLMNLRSNTIITKVHGPGACEDIEDRWKIKTAKWLAWKERNS